MFEAPELWRGFAEGILRLNTREIRVFGEERRDDDGALLEVLLGV